MAVPTADEFQAVVEKASKGDRGAIATLWRDNQPGLLGWLKAVEPKAADDLASETWIDALRNLRNFSGSEANFRSFLFTVARRRVIDYRRREMRRLGAMNEVVPETSGEDVEGVVAARLDAISAARLMAALLPAAQTEVILLRLVGGLDAAQVAEITGHSIESVRVLQHRGLQKLARRLESKEFVTEEVARSIPLPR